MNILGLLFWFLSFLFSWHYILTLAKKGLVFKIGSCVLYICVCVCICSKSLQKPPSKHHTHFCYLPNWDGWKDGKNTLSGREIYICKQINIRIPMEAMVHEHVQLTYTFKHPYFQQIQKLKICITSLMFNTVCDTHTNDIILLMHTQVEWKKSEARAFICPFSFWAPPQFSGRASFILQTWVDVMRWRTNCPSLQTN